MAAAAVFVGAALPESVRFVGIWVITALFYIVGLLLRVYVPKLKPAATAFVGTGLALLPFTGIAMYNFALPDAPLCWLITSIIGLIAFAIAAAIIRSQVISYFAIAFMVSLVTSSVATLGVGMMWYFVVLIVFGSLMTVVSKLKPNWLPEYFTGPVQKTDKWIVPLTLVASLCAAPTLTVRDYFIVALVSTFYYAAVAASTQVGRVGAIFVTRLLASFAILFLAYDISKSWVAVGIWMSVIGIIQILISLIFAPKHKVGDGNNEPWMWIGFVMQVIAPIFLIGNSLWADIATVQAIALLVTSFGIAIGLRRVGFAGFGTYALSILPFLVGTTIIKPAIDLQIIAVIFMVFAVSAAIVLSIKNFITSHPSTRLFLVINMIFFMTLSLIFITSADIGLLVGMWLVASGLMYYLVYLERKPWISIVANTVLVVAIIWSIELFGIQTAWKSLFVAFMSFIVFYGSHLLLSSMSKKQYAVYFWWSTIVIVGITCLGSLFGYESEVSLSASVGLIALGGIIAAKGWAGKQYGFISVGAILATIAMQRMLSIAMPEANWLVYTHWWSAVAVGLGYLYRQAGKRATAKAWVIIALSIMSFFSGIAAIVSAIGVEGDVPYKLIFLGEHIALVIAGLLLSRKLFTIWGAVGVILAILWLLSGYTFLFLAFAAFVLIGGAIFALIRQSKNSK